MALADVLDDEHIIVDTQWNEKELIKQVPGARWDPTAKHWTVPLTWASCIILRGVFRETLTIGDRLREWAWPVATEMNERIAMRSLVEPEMRVLPQLYPFQEIGARFLVRTKETILGDEMGTGKTVQTIAALNITQALPAIVVCPNSVKRHWEREFRTWSMQAEPYVVEGGAAGRAKILKEAAKDPHAVVIINYESLRTMSRLAPYGSVRLRRCRECDRKNGEETLRASQCQVHPKPLNEIPWKTVIIDEAHRIKSPQSQQTRAVWAVAHQPSVTYRWALTGTPLANHPGDLWSIFHAVSPRDFPTKTHYVDRYCLQSWNAFGGLDIVGVNPATRDEFFSLLDPRFRRMPKDLVLSQLPPKIRTQRWVEMTPAQRRMYNAFKQDLAVITDTGAIYAEDNRLSDWIRMMQLSSSSIELDGDRIRMVEPSPKLDALEEVLEELGDKPVAICAQSKQLINMASARLTKLKIPHGLITGDVNEYERDRALREFQDGKLRALLFTVQAGGVGLTMTAADTIIFLQRSWSMIDNKQAEDRVHRIGSERHESVHVIDIVTRDSIEEDQIESLTEKFMRLQEIARDRQTLADTHALDEEEAAVMRSTL